MESFPHAPGDPRLEGTTRPDDTDSIDSTRARMLWANKGPTQVVFYAPKERFRLGYFDVMCLVINRTIGTGIFNSPQRVMIHTRSTGASLLLWFVGMIYCLSGLHVYLEYGLNIPRYTIDGVEQPVPRSGGDLNYLQYVYRKPAYRKGTVLLSTCIFGIAFIALGNMAGNSISFAIRVMSAAGNDSPDNGTVRGIAIAIAIITCFIHAVSRRFGIWLNNVLAVIKVCILLLVIITAIVVGAGGLNTPNVLPENTNIKTAFEGRSTDLNDYSHAFLAIIFSFSGFEQPNYVLGEISRPRRKYPVASIVGVTTTVLLYLAMNISYMVVVPKEDQLTAPGGVAERFFELTLGNLGTSENQIVGKRIFNAFLAVSSLGNIIVMTYTAARVKQEIAKEGILPYPAFFAQSTDLSVGRFLRWIQKKGWFNRLLSSRWLSPDSHREKTPVGALVLHCACCMVLILATWRLTPAEAYTILTSISSYVINGAIGTFIGLGILILRFRGPPSTPAPQAAKPLEQPTTKPSWKRMTGRHFNPVLSVVCASLYTVGNLWPVVTQWVPKRADPSTGDSPTPEYTYTAGVKSFVIPTIGWGIIGLGVAWFLGFLAVAQYKRYNYHEVFVVDKKPDFENASSGTTGDESAARGSNGLVMVHETVYLSWVGKETLRQRRPGAGAKDDFDGSLPVPSDPYAGTDFSGHFQAQQQQQSHYGMEMGPMSPQTYTQHNAEVSPGFRPASFQTSPISPTSNGNFQPTSFGVSNDTNPASYQFHGAHQQRQQSRSTRGGSFADVRYQADHSSQRFPAQPSLAEQPVVEYDDFGNVIGGRGVGRM
ncbi:unnamed protein product [Clonostachys byssicola]|uniref:High-affinity methionine permease n=1 Tax=Clonostachys byssicola TaxID=160290 RepID=A0A9N9XW84_9HYPO|nr:unnamed protein product [Clonostachys byssicola]